MSISGCTGSGKTTWVRKLMKYTREMFEGPSPDNILYCYGIYQNAFDEMEKELPNLTFLHGLPSELDINALCQNGDHNMIIIDDLMHEVVKNGEMERLFTQGAHHRRLTIVYLNQNMYCQGKHSRNINLNTHYMILLKNPRDVNQIRCLGRQVFGGKSNALIEAYNDCLSSPYGYLVLDLTPHAEEQYRIRTGIFPDETCIVYIPK